MSLTLLSDPSKLISGYNSIYAATSQLRYEFRRDDFANIAAGGTPANNFDLDSADGDQTSVFTPGVIFYYQDSNPANEGYYTVSSSTYTTKTTVNVNENVPAVTGPTGEMYVPSLYDNYYVQVVIQELNNLNLFYAVDLEGKIIFDLGRILYDSIDQSLLFKVETTEIWEGSSESPVTQGTYLAVKANKQILSQYGSNLFDHVIYSTQAREAEVLTNQAVPRFWTNWKRSFSFINDDFTTVQYVEIELDLNKASVGGNTYATQPVNADAVNERLFQKTSYVNNAAYVRMYVETAALVKLTANKDYLIEPECREPVMVEFVNQLGAFDQWLFSLEQAVTDEAENGLIYENAVNEDFSTVTQTKSRIVKDSKQLMTLKAGHLSQNDIQHLHEIKLSEIVRVWLTKDGTQYVNVIVNSGYQTTFTTGKGGYQFSLNIEFPNNFDFFKAKSY